MGTVTSGVGLISGLDFQSIIDQLISIDARPREQVANRIGRIDAQRTAYADISARVNALLSNINGLIRPSAFRTNSTSTSTEGILSATANANAQPGTQSFIVQSLASTHQLVSRGFAARNEPINVGTITVESAAARVNEATELEALNSGQGIPRGSIELTASDGTAATVSLRSANTLNDVVDLINETDIGLTARIDRDRLVIEDTAGGTESFSIRDVDGAGVAAALGFAPGNQSASDAPLVGSDLIGLTTESALSQLRDGLGIRTSRGGNDFTISTGAGDFSVDLSGILKPDTRLARLNHGQGVELGTIQITTRNGVSTEVDLSAADTVQDVRNAIDAVEGISVTIGGEGLVIKDETEGPDNSAGTKIEDVSGRAAQDLGIAKRIEADEESIKGGKILHVTTLADVVSAINDAAGNEDGFVSAAIAADGKRLELTNNFGGALTLTAGDSNALTDLGFTAGTTVGNATSGARIVGGVNTTLLNTLNGGNGINGSTITIEAGGNSATVDITNFETLEEVLAAVREEAANSGIDATFAFNSNGTRLIATSNTADPLTISGDAADALGLSGSGAQIRGENLQRRYINENTQLDTLNNGAGISLGSIRITNSTGASTTLDLQSDPPETIQDVIDAVNGLGIDVRAEINDTGDGLRIIDESGGAGTFSIADVSGTAARDLNLLNDAENGVIDGAFEFEIDLGNSGTLDDLATAIDGTSLATARVINDGSSVAPFRLNISSTASGRDGALLIDSADGNFTVDTLTQARDARVVIGNDAATGITITSSSNTIEDVVGGLTLDLQSVSDDPVTVQVSQDLGEATETIKSVVEDYNAVLDRIRELAGYDPETESRGILLGESVPRAVERRLFSLFSRQLPGATGDIKRLRDIGIRFEAGAKLSFDETKFQEAYAESPDDVIRFFTDTENGAAKYLSDELKELSEADGLIDRRDDSLEQSKTQLERRVEQLDARLTRKRERLLRQFQAMEAALAQLQGQQASLSSFSPVAAAAPVGPG